MPGFHTRPAGEATDLRCCEHILALLSGFCYVDPQIMYIDDAYITLKFPVFEARLLEVLTSMACVKFYSTDHACDNLDVNVDICLHCCTAEQTLFSRL